MGASKKQRGKQRKAAKSKAAEGGIDINISDQVSPTKLVKLIQRGDHAATELYICGDYTLSRIQTEKVVTSILGHLQRCENETFDKVLYNLGGDMTCPSRWIDLIHRASMFEHENRSNSNFLLQIAQRVGPLVRCMCDDVNRLFFQSNQHWKESFEQFVLLVWYILDGSIKSNILDGSLEQETIKTLLRHENLLASIVQWSFWNRSNSPGFAIGLSADEIRIIYNCGRLATKKIVKNIGDLRETIATTPIKDYDPDNCTVSHVAEFISQMMASGWEADDFQTLHHLIVDADCVDKGVIKGIVDFGLDLISNTDPNLSADTAIISSAHVMNISRAMIHHEGSPSDTRVAFAIRVGLIEMCVGFMVRFGGQADHDISTNLFQFEQDALNAMHGVALHKKSRKAIRHKRQDIEEKLEHLDTSIIHNVKCKELLDMVKSILDMNGVYCCHCNKSLGRTERFQCGGCNRMTYCSRSCQRSDWLNGHSPACCRAYSGANIGQFQGRIIPTTIPDDERAAAKLEELEINNNMIQLKVFLDHSSTILDQAKSLNIPLCDCFVKFELRHCSPKVTIHHYTDVYGDEAEGKLFEANRSEKNIHCMFYSYNFTGDSSTCLGEPTAMLAMQRLFPFEWLTQKK